MSIFNEYIILFRNLLKLVYPLADFRIVLILELAPSIGPLESIFPWYLMKEFFIQKKFTKMWIIPIGISIYVEDGFPKVH